jgi:hypothetical protein
LVIVWSAILKAVLAKRAFAGLARIERGVDEAEAQKYGTMQEFCCKNAGNGEGNCRG